MMPNSIRQKLTAKEKRILDGLYAVCCGSKKGIGSICRDDWPHAKALSELGLIEFQALIDDRAWWLTDVGVRVAHDIATP